MRILRIKDWRSPAGTERMLLRKPSEFVWSRIRERRKRGSKAIIPLLFCRRGEKITRTLDGMAK